MTSSPHNNECQPSSTALQRFGEGVAAWIWDHRRWSLWTCIVLTIVAACPLRNLQIDNSIAIWFLEEDEELVNYQAFQQEFGSDEVIAIALHDEDGILRRQGLQNLQQATSDIRRVKGIAHVISLAPMAEAQGSTHKELTDPLMSGWLISDDGKTAMVIAYPSLENLEQNREQIITDVRAALAPLDVEYHMAGIGVVHTALNRLSTTDSGVLIVASFTVISILLWLLFGRLAPMAVSLAVIAITATWVMGLFAMSGRHLDMVTMVMPTLVSIIGVANCVHILQHVARLPRTADQRTRVIQGVGYILGPCLFNTLTTASGFLALTISPMPVIRSLGLFCAIGMFMVLVVSIVLCTWALKWPAFEPREAQRQRLGRWAAHITVTGLRRPRLVIGASIVVAAVAVVGVTQVVVDTYSIDFLYADHPVRQDYDFIEKNIGGYTPLEFVVDSEEGVLRPHVLDAVAEWQRRVESLEQVSWSLSIASALQAEPAPGALPSELGPGAPPFEAGAALARERLGPLWPMMVSESGAMRVTFGTCMQESSAFAETIDLALAQAHLPEGVTVRATGYMPLYVRMMDHLVWSQVRSFTLAFIVIFVAIGVLFRSFRIAWIAVPGNLLPVLITLGLMGFAGIRLDIATSVIAAMLLGIVVDDSVLLLYQLRHEQRRFQGGRHEDARQAMLAAARSTGPCLAITTIVLVIGLSVLTLAQIKSIVWLGVLMPVAMVAALVTDLTLLPAFMLMSMRWRTRSPNHLTDASPPNEKISAVMQRGHRHGQ